MPLAFAACALSVGASLSGCIGQADQALRAAPPLSSEKGQSGLSELEMERAAIDKGLGRRDALVRACMEARGFGYDADEYSRNKRAGSNRAVDYLDGRYWHIRRGK